MLLKYICKVYSTKNAHILYYSAMLCKKAVPPPDQNVGKST